MKSTSFFTVFKIYKHRHVLSNKKKHIFQSAQKYFLHKSKIFKAFLSAVFLIVLLVQ